MIDKIHFMDAISMSDQILKNEDLVTFAKTFDPTEITVMQVLFLLSMDAYRRDGFSPDATMMMNALIFYFLGFRDGITDQKEVQELEKINMETK